MKGLRRTISETKNLSQPTFSEAVNGGTVCRKAARTGLWGSGEVTNRSSRNQLIENLMIIQRIKHIINTYNPNSILLEYRPFDSITSIK